MTQWTLTSEDLLLLLAAIALIYIVLRTYR